MIDNERYEYKGLIYCEEDISDEFNNYGGNFLDLYYELRRDRKVSEETKYYIIDDYFGRGYNCYYDREEDLVKNNYEKLGVNKIG